MTSFEDAQKKFWLQLSLDGQQILEEVRINLGVKGHSDKCSLMHMDRSLAMTLCIGSR